MQTLREGGGSRAEEGVTDQAANLMIKSKPKPINGPASAPLDPLFQGRGLAPLLLHSELINLPRAAPSGLPEVTALAPLVLLAQSFHPVTPF